MSATTITPQLTLDVSGTKPVPFARLVKVETRKMYDTRAGFWLLAAIAAITLVIITIFFFAAKPEEQTFFNFLGVTATPQGFLLPVLGILLIISEWGQRTTLTTFALNPKRGRVIWAKVCAALLFGLGAIVIAVGLAALATLIAGQPGGWDNVGLDDFGKFGLLQIMGIIGGLAFGLIFLNSAAAIVISFVVPIAFSIVASLWGALEKAAPWVDLGTSQPPLYSGDSLSGEQWAQLGTSSLIWIVLPFLAGLWRVMRAEVK